MCNVLTKLFSISLIEAKKQIVPTYPQDTQGLPFDFKSIMLYSKTLGAKSSGLVTMEAKKNPAMELGNDNDMSALDIRRVNQYYGCAELADACKDYSPGCFWPVSSF